MKRSVFALLLASACSAAIAQSHVDGFAPDVNGTVHAIAVQSDGKILIGGRFTSVAGSLRTNLARLNPDGSLDSPFTAAADFSVYATHRGSQVWYIDTAGYIHLFLNGIRNGARAGDGTWFYNPFEARVSEIRAVTTDHAGNLLITENDIGFIRRIEFLPFGP